MDGHVDATVVNLCVTDSDETQTCSDGGELFKREADVY